MMAKKISALALRVEIDITRQILSDAESLLTPVGQVF